MSRLPDAPLVVYMAGRKFGSTGQESLTWAMNAALPVAIARRYAGSRIAAFSTGNVYGLTPVAGGGSRETDPLRPVGEYAMSCLARERIFEHFSHRAGHEDHPAAAQLRHRDALRPARGSRDGGLLTASRGPDDGLLQRDLAGRRQRHGARVRSRTRPSPALVVNLAGPGPLSVRESCQALAARLGVAVALHRDARRPTPC